LGDLHIQHRKTLFAIKPGKTRLHAKLAGVWQWCVEVHVLEAVGVTDHIASNAL